MIAAALAALVVAVVPEAAPAVPELRLEGDLGPGVATAAARGWESAARALQAEGLVAADPRPIRLRRAPPGGAAGESVPGLVELGPGVAGPGDARGEGVVRHELAHQLLFAACPSASADRLFHEAFALAVSGELEGWLAGPYLPVAGALHRVTRAGSLTSSDVRRALARLVAEAPRPAGRLPVALARRLGACGAGARWAPLRPEELASADATAADALVVLSRHSGEVLASEGAATLPLPFGSTLKPFLLAGARSPAPRLAPDPARPGWACGDLDGPMDAATALLRSCNGWFLDWAAATPEVARLGGWGPALRALGLSALPADAPEAIGVRPALTISPLGLAGAYRLLADARPDLFDVLSRNAREGTLSGLEASPALEGVALKTGTVLDGAGNPRLGWIVAVDADVVLVVARAGRTPRSFAGEAARALRGARGPARGAARVQVFGLVEAKGVRARCARAGFALTPDGPLAVEGPVDVAEAARRGPLACVGGPWLVEVPGSKAGRRDGPRAYAGVFTLEPAPPAGASPGPGATAATAREARARRGSDLVFRTTRLLYAAGVVAAEDAASAGPARVALARVADANARQARHPGRPVCDTTHCQAFLGTARAGKDDREALAQPLQAAAWLPFSRGGLERWRAVRDAAEVARALGGAEARRLAFRAGRASWSVTVQDGKGGAWEERRDAGCEALRGPLHLPSCPVTATARGAEVVFEGRGAGHGEGLDLEWAKRSGLSAGEILRRSFGATLRP
ncbi:MAG: SpoIID/LytB domain-containing protein [Anaeromyxobacter sp.]